jgi:hypothetical protein
VNFKLSFLFILITSIFFLQSCAEDPSDIGINLISSDLVHIEIFDSQTQNVQQSSGYFKRIIPLGLSTKLLVGTYEDIEASALLKFIFSFSDTVKQDIINGNIIVEDAWIELTRNYLFGDTTGTIDFTTHKVNNKWSATAFTIDSLQILDYNSEDEGSDYLQTDSNYTFHLSTDMVLSWMKNSADANLESNEGIYLKPGSSTGTILGFEAFSAIAENPPRLNVIISKAGVYTDTINGFILADVSLVDGNLPDLPSDNFAVQSSIAVNGTLHFDLSEIPAGVVINRAELTLTADTLNSKKGTSFNNSLQSFFAKDSTTHEIEGSGTTLGYFDNKYSGVITAFVRRWINENKNHGMIIRPGNENEGLELFALKNSQADSLSRPRLRVTYTIREGL